MMKKYMMLCLPLFFLTGCWDQNPLQKDILILATAIDKKDKQSIIGTVELRTNEQVVGGPSVPLNETLSATGHNIKDIRLKLDRNFVGTYSPNKIRVILLGEELAKEDINLIIVSYLRDPKLTPVAKVAVVKGKAAKIINMKKYQNKLIGEALFKQLESLEKASVYPGENQQTIKNKISDVGKDFVLPFIEKKGKKKVEITGVALFHGSQYTGFTLRNFEPVLLMLMENKKNKQLVVTEKYRKGEDRKDFVSFSVKKIKRKLKVNTRNGKPSVHLQEKLEIELQDYSGKSLKNKEELEKLNRSLSQKLEKEMNQIVHTLQKANCDALGIGRKIIAYHPGTWKKLNWEKDYPDVPISIHVEVNTINRGLIF